MHVYIMNMTGHDEDSHAKPDSQPTPALSIIAEVYLLRSTPDMNA